MSDHHLFRSVKGRVYHESDTPVQADHIAKDQIVAICGARFDRWYTYGPKDHKPTCPKCRRVLAERAALVPIAAALMSEYGE